MWWPFKKNDRSIQARLVGLSCDISVLYQRTYQLKRFLQFELIDRIDKMDKRLRDLEKLLKSSDSITFTIMEKK